MSEPALKNIKKYHTGLLRLKKKYVSSERLSKYIGVYPEIISEDLSYFEPTLIMDSEYNLMKLLPLIEEFIERKKAIAPKKVKATPVKKKELNKYSSIGDFVYKKMTFAGGLVDKNVVLTDEDLAILNRLVTQEISKRKK